MDCSTPGLPVHHQLPEHAQTQVPWVGDAVQPSHPLSSPSLPAFSLSQHQGLFQRVRSLHQMAKVLELQLLRQSFQGTFRTDFFRTDWVDLLAVQGTLKSLLQHHRVYLPVSLGNHPVYLCLMTLVSSFQLNNLQGERIIILYFKASLPMWAGPGVIKWLPKSQTKFLENILILSKSTIKPHSDSVISMNYDCECCSNIATIRYF